MRYLDDSLKGDLKYTKLTQDEDILEIFVDFDYSGNVDIRKSLSCFVFTLFKTTISWKETQQSLAKLYTTKA